MRFLDSEIEDHVNSNSSTFGHDQNGGGGGGAPSLLEQDPQEMIQILEDKTEMLKRQLNLRNHRHKSIGSSDHCPSPQNGWLICV